MSAQKVREAIALAIFRAEMDDAAAEFETDEQWRSRLSIFDTTPNPRVQYLPLADAVLRALGERLAPPSALAGATTPGEECSWPLDAGEFAARYNGLDEASRAEFVRRVISAGQNSSRCFELNHDGQIEGLHSTARYLRSLVARFDPMTSAGIADEVGLWFADLDDSARPDCAWQPVVTVPDGVSSLQIWFQTEDDCLAWMRQAHLPLAPPR